MVTRPNIAEWRGTELVEHGGDKIGKLEDVYVYVDVETGEPIFGPDKLQVPVSSEQVKDAPAIALDGDELSQRDESGLCHDYDLNYTSPASESGRGLVRR